MTTCRTISPRGFERFQWSLIVVVCIVTRSSAPQAEDASTEDASSNDAIADPDETNAQARAMMLYQVAELRYEEGRFEEAIILLREALVLSDLCPLHYNLGRALQETGQWEASREEYLAFLECDEDPQLEPRVLARIEYLEQLIQARAAEQDRVSTENTAVERGDGQLLLASGDEEARRSPWPWVLVSTGTVSLVVGAVFGSLFLSQRALVNDQATPQLDAFQAHDSGQTYGISAMATLISGGAVALIGLIWGIVDLLAASNAGSPEGQ